MANGKLHTNMRWLDEKELEAIDNFMTKHIIDLDCYKNNNPNHKSLGFTVNYDWTGIGIATTITCNCCGEKENVTNYDTW